MEVSQNKNMLHEVVSKVGVRMDSPPWKGGVPVGRGG